MLLRMATYLLFSAAIVFAICDQGGGFDPTYRIVIGAQQPVSSLPSARQLLGTDVIGSICDKLEADVVFRCAEHWSTGMAGYALSNTPIPQAISAALPPEANGLIFQVQGDIYYQNQIGPTSPPSTPLPQCVLNQFRRKLAAAAAATPPTYTGPPTYAPVYSQVGAEATLSFLSAYASPTGKSCFPNCQQPNTFRYAATGRGVTVYIVDQAIANHTDFQRSDGTYAISSDRWYSPPALANVGQQCASWHGTHVGGIVAGTLYGVAKDAELVSVAVQPGCNQDGRTSDLIAGLDWVLTRHLKQKGPAIVSMSLIVDSSGAGQILAQQVAELISAGVTVVVAAGNFANDACDYEPANLPDVITVAAAQLDTVRDVPYASAWALSDTGPCVTIWAPGAFVQSDSSTGPSGVAIYSGTSQATPAVSGLAAHFLERCPTASPAAVMAHLMNTSFDALTGAPAKTTSRVAQVALDFCASA